MRAVLCLLAAACAAAPPAGVAQASRPEPERKAPPVPPTGQLFELKQPRPPELPAGHAVDNEGLAALLAEIEAARARGDAGKLHERYVDEANRAMAMAPDAPSTRVGDLPRSASEARLLAALSTADDEQAWQLCQDIQDSDPQYGMVHVALAILYERWRIPHQARAAYQRALRMMPQNPIARVGLARLHRLEGDEASAREALGKVVEELPSFADAHYELGSLMHASSDLQPARERLERAVSLDPGHVRALRELGEVRVKLGQRDEAIGAYRAAVAVARDDRALQRALAGLLEEKGDLRGATLAYEAALSDPPDVSILRAVAALHQKLGDAPAETAFQKRVIKADPKDVAAHRRLAELELAAGNRDAAEAEYRAALAASEEDGAAHLGLARLLKNKGALRDALGHLRAAFAGGMAEARAEVAALEKELEVPRPPLRASDVNVLYREAFVGLRKFYKARLANRPGLAGKLGVKVTVDEEGAVREAQMVEDTIRDPALEAHLYWALRDARYPAGTRDYTFRFELSARER